MECDLEYPGDLRGYIKDFSLVPTKECFKQFWLCEYQFEILHNINLNGNFRVKKLLQTLYNKERYILQYIILKLYVLLGLKAEKNHRCLKFTQNQRLLLYIDLKTYMREGTANKFEVKFFILRTNCDNSEERNPISRTVKFNSRRNSNSTKL